MKAIHFVIFALFSVFSHAVDKPNILWITSEDNGVKWIGCYGGTNAQTPNIDTLASEGFRYLHCFDNAAVCAPTRSTWITGMLAISNGTQPMRSGNAIPDKISFYNELLQKAGYFTANCNKTDYNLRGRGPAKGWDYHSGDYQKGWQSRKKGQPFFTVINIMDSHESRAFGSLKADSKKPADMKLRSYHPDLPEMRETYAIYSRSVEKMDEKVGKIIEALKADGVYEDTIICYTSDHGGVLPRSKRFLYSSGIHVPMIMRIPQKWQKFWPAAKPGMTVDRLVSFIDMPKTWVSLAGGSIAENFQGKIFLGDGIEPEPAHHFAFRGRADDRFDCVRVMREKRYAYHRNYAPFAPNGQYLAYMHNMKATGAWEKYHQAGKTNAITGRFFEPRVSAEFYDNKVDFDNVNNLIDAPEHQQKVAELKAELRRQQLKYFDSGLLPEEMRNRRARNNNLTIYEMVRDPKLYPLEKYLDAADLALARDKKNLAIFKTQLADTDAGMRYWAVIGLLLLEQGALAATAELKNALKDEHKEVYSFAAWALHKIGEKKLAEDFMYKVVAKDSGRAKVLVNIFDWMGEDAKPILSRLAEKPQKKSFFADIMKRSGIKVEMIEPVKKKKK